MRETARAALIEGFVRQAVAYQGYYAEVQRIGADDESSPEEVQMAKEVLREVDRRKMLPSRVRVGVTPRDGEQVAEAFETVVVRER